MASEKAPNTAGDPQTKANQTAFSLFDIDQSWKKSMAVENTTTSIPIAGKGAKKGTKIFRQKLL
jgi:hypothetical protein